MFPTHEYLLRYLLQVLTRLFLIFFLYSLFAHQAGALNIHGCDYSQTMIKIALQVLHKNGLVGRIKLTNKLSNNLIIPRDLPER